MTIVLPRGSRLLIEAQLEPMQGARFQPTGFPALGPATYQLADGTRMLLVESAQSMANRLEATVLEPGTVQPLAFLDGMPYILVKEGDRVVTTSLVEAHRINSPYILEGDDTSMRDALISELKVAEESAVSEARLASVLCKYDPSTLLHGVFLAKKDIAGGRFRLRRALSAFIEARDAEVVSSGGVKNDHVNPSGETKEGFGNVPFAREEFTAGSITAYFNLDLAQLRSYRLPEEMTRFLTLLGMWKIRTLLDGGLRLRTACDFAVTNMASTRPSGFELPTTDALQEEITPLVKQCVGHFANPAITTVSWSSGSSKKGAARKAKGAKVEATEDSGDDES